MTHFIVSNLGEYSAILDTGHPAGKILVNIMLGYLFFLKNLNGPFVKIPSLIHAFTI